MYGVIEFNRISYKKRPLPGEAYRQIVVVELEQFQMRILVGDVVQPDPNFAANSDFAEVYFFSDLAMALEEAKKEEAASLKAGWIPYP